MIKIVWKRIQDVFFEILREHIIQKYGKGSDICIATKYNNENIIFTTSSCVYTTPIKDPKFNLVRRQLGENILMKNGFSDSGKPYRLVLIPTFSMFFALGFKKFRQILKDWPGSSTVKDIEVIRHSILK